MDIEEIKEINNLDELKKRVKTYLYSTYLNSDIFKWKYYNTDYSYIEDNISFYISKPSSTSHTLKITIHNTVENANLGSYSNIHGSVYTEYYTLTWTWFSTLLRRRMHSKFKKIINFREDKDEYINLSEAINALPIKMQRKEKLKKIKENE